MVHGETDAMNTVQELVTVSLRQVSSLSGEDNGETHVDGDGVAVAQGQGGCKLEGR